MYTALVVNIKCKFYEPQFGNVLVLGAGIDIRDLMKQT